ncbi:MAG TPA: hypothetical protein VFM17_03935 [Candidatus Eisenbacteria bacterium]|nr:hypothetical protein [Candidatus Eisenbacteria bacterium]
MSKPSAADAELLIRLYELRRDPEMRKARQFIISEFKAASWDEMQSQYLTGSEPDRYFRMVTSYWELVAGMVNRGVLNEELLFDTHGEDIVVWNRVKAVVPGARATIRPTYLWNLERMARRHMAWREATYPTATETIEAGSTLGAKPGKAAKPPKPKKAKKHAR